MTMNRPQIPAGTLRTASVIVMVFAIVMLIFGQTLFQTGSHDKRIAQSLQEVGMPGTVTDARAKEGRYDGKTSVSSVELTFVDSEGGEHVLVTNHFPRYYPPLDSPGGWVDDFATKNEIIGQPVSYRLGADPAVELDSEIPALAAAGWDFPHYLGITFMVMGVGAAIGAVVSFIRARSRLRKSAL